MHLSLHGKVALIMGAGSIGPGWGNGKATAVTFARAGAVVVCADRALAAAEETAGLILADGGQAIALSCDVADADQINATVEAVRARFGRIDVLDNNVGIAEHGGVLEVSPEAWDRTFTVNVRSAYLAMRAVLPGMIANGGGAIVNISSIAAHRAIGVPFAAYSASKAALSHLTRTTAIEVARHKVRVNAVVPGLMKTPMVETGPGFAAAYSKGDIEKMWAARDAQVPLGHMGDAFDVANAALFLCSDAARYITGHELIVDGGITLKTGA